MSRCIQCILYLLLALALIGGFILLTGVGTLPSTNQGTIDPQTGFIYTLEQQNDNYRKILFASAPFKLVIVGSILAVVSLSTIAVIYLIRKRCYSESIIFPELSPSRENPMVDQQPFEPVPVTVAVSTQPVALATTGSAALAAHMSDALATNEVVGQATTESVPISPLMKHLPSTIHEPPSRAAPKHPVTWNELRLEHLQGHTTSV